MTKITVKADCGNSPKKEFLKDFNIAFAEGNAEFIISNVSDDIHWTILGDKELKGLEHFSREINVMKNYIVDELVIHNVITHGKEGAVNGEIIMGNQSYSFCDVYKFINTRSNKIAEMKSYVIKTTED